MRRRKRLLYIGRVALRAFAVILIALASLRAQDKPELFEGQTVVRISYDPDPQPIAMAELTEMLPLKRDQP